MFCRETLADLRARNESDPGFPDTLLFFQGGVMEGKALLRRDWPQARAVADLDAESYERFGVHREGLVEMFRGRRSSARPRRDTATASGPGTCGACPARSDLERGAA